LPPNQERLHKKRSFLSGLSPLAEGASIFYSQKRPGHLHVRTHSSRIKTGLHRRRLPHFHPHPWQKRSDCHHHGYRINFPWKHGA